MVTNTENRGAVKQSLSTQLGIVRALFQQALQQLQSTGKNRYNLPWYLLLGEPGSGKSE